VSFAVDYFWFAFFLGWCFKVVLMRLGGLRAHHFGLPFAMGLILGDFTMGSLWSLITLLFQVPTYRIYI
jgi:predicted metal-binding membrane protein